MDVVLNVVEGRRSSPKMRLMTLLFPALVSPNQERNYIIEDNDQALSKPESVKAR